MSEQTAYPLTWPEGWPRTRFRRASNFRRTTSFVARGHSMDEACRMLQTELDRLKTTRQVLSCNVKRRLDGAPYSGQAQPNDTGVAVYFELKGKPVSLACDKWDRVEDNVWAIAKHIEALRGQERWGVGSVERAFTGYTALPAPGQTGGLSWWNVLGVAINATPDQVKDAFRILAKKHHPDAGGDAELFHRINAAWEQYNRVSKVAA